MNKISNLEILDLIDRLQKSEAVNYLESRERLFLSNMSEKIRSDPNMTNKYAKSDLHEPGVATGTLAS